MSETINFKTGWLKDPADNQKFAPKTTTNQVLIGDGNRLTDKLQELEASIGDLASLPIEKGEGENSLQTATNQAIGNNSVAFGKDTVAGYVINNKDVWYGHTIIAPNQIRVDEWAGWCFNTQPIEDEFHEYNGWYQILDGDLIIFDKSGNITPFNKPGDGLFINSEGVLGGIGEGSDFSLPVGKFFSVQSELHTIGDWEQIEVGDEKNNTNAYAEGHGTKALGQNQHVQGKYNVEDTESKYAHIVGGGSSDTKRKNIHTLDWNGNAWYAGEIYVGGTSQNKGKKLATIDALETVASNKADKNHSHTINDLPNTLIEYNTLNTVDYFPEPGIYNYQSGSLLQAWDDEMYQEAYDNSGFYWASELELLVTPASLSIGIETEGWFSNFRQVIIGKGTTSISLNAFSWSGGTGSLESIVVPTSVSNIWSGIEEYSLDTIYYMGTEEQWNQIEINDRDEFANYGFNIVFNYKIPFGGESYSYGTLKDNSGNTFYPTTKANSVVMSNGNILEETLDTQIDFLSGEIDKLIDNKADTGHGHKHIEIDGLEDTYETKVDASNKYTESKAYTDREVAKKAALSTDGFFTSKRDFVNGTLITTNIDYSVDGGESWLLEIKGNSYTSKIPFDLKLQGYIYKTDSDSMINYGGISNGFFFDDIVAFCYNTQLCFWFPKIAYWHGFDVRVTKLNTATAENANCVISVTDEAKPENITKEVSFKGTIVKSITSDDIASQSVDYASKATYDDQGRNIITTYATKSEAEGYANTVKNDLLNGAGGAYDTLKELGELIDTNVDAIDALETVAASKESKTDAEAKLREAKNEVAALSQAIIIGEITANKAINADKATKDASGNIITSTYETKADATSKYNELNTKVEKATPFVAAYNQTSFNDIKAAYDLGRPIQVYREFELPAAGAYDADDNMIYSWQELLDMDVEYEELDGYDETGANIWATKVGKCLTVEDGVLKSIVTYSPSTDSYTNWSRNALVDVTKLVIDNSVTTIKYNGLTGFKIEEFILPNTLTTIEEDAFSYVDYAVIYIPRSVTNISYRAFYGSWYLMIKYEGTEEAFNTIASIMDFNMNAHELMYSYNCRVLHDPIYGYLKNATENNFVFTSREDTGEVEYICNSYGWSTRNIQSIKLGDATFKYDYDNARIIISFPDGGAVG